MPFMLGIIAQVHESDPLPAGASEMPDDETQRFLAVRLHAGSSRNTGISIEDQGREALKQGRVVGFEVTRMYCAEHTIDAPLQVIVDTIQQLLLSGSLAY